MCISGGPIRLFLWTLPSAPPLLHCTVYSYFLVVTTMVSCRESFPYLSVFGFSKARKAISVSLLLWLTPSLSLKRLSLTSASRAIPLAPQLVQASAVCLCVSKSFQDHASPWLQVTCRGDTCSALQTFTTPGDKGTWLGNEPPHILSVQRGAQVVCCSLPLPGP